MTKTEILTAMKEGDVSLEEALELLHELEEVQPRECSVTMTEKGCVQIRGIRGINIRFGFAIRPVTWTDLKANGDKIDKFIKDNLVELTRRGEASRKASDLPVPKRNGNGKPTATASAPAGQSL